MIPRNDDKVLPLFEDVSDFKSRHLLFSDSDESPYMRFKSPMIAINERIMVSSLSVLNVKDRLDIATDYVLRSYGHYWTTIEYGCVPKDELCS
jgi:hypothetical protein